MSLRHRTEAIKELLGRYRESFLFWWERRKQLDLPDLKAHEAEFLPAALSLQATPVSPAGRWVARILIGFIFLILLWSIFGKVDIIVNGQGKIIAGGYTKTIASVETAKVIGLFVEEGQHVKAGDLLIELDARGADSDHNKAEGDRQLALLQMERSKALLSAIQTSTPPTLAPIQGVDEAHYQSAVSHMNDQWGEYSAKRARIASQVKRYSAALPLATRRANNYAELAKDHDVSEHAYLEKEQARIEILGQLDDAKTQLASLTSETRKTLQDELYQATRIWSGAAQDVNKAAAHSEQLRIMAPVDGTIQQLAVHTIGGVVPAAQTIMVLVPDSQNVELEAYIENKDIGFLRDGQKAQVKIDAYEYIKYGTIPAIVSHVSRDAIDFSSNGSGSISNKDPQTNKEGPKGLLYAVKVTIDKPSIVVDGKDMPLTPGMTANVEIKTGERRIIEYVLSPLITHGRESLHER
ncbi:HlyD family type I secretion periplasmic adaptor subunit [Polynucleobacter sp. JS-Safj-400b-B2]|uniref:HlyD family type I secretion periplasmic adaptor subunit n=1 Tax=Polynucleobacter sp. JS-Safj-400b-B2 TaxID=2576921 RepID=UPI001C0BE02E|nr:HlyD family type I secretion periplasmic adaptor subunit [Polynucleobacter sp. JS-Safj-400b-B2]MBU3627081.1 HlyD family type I secretion periplasmic adaptor subunit [Polynucleobacter sp. JS-Safj-400b-B2]